MFDGAKQIDSSIRENCKNFSNDELIQEIEKIRQKMLTTENLVGKVLLQKIINSYENELKSRKQQSIN